MLQTQATTPQDVFDRVVGELIEKLHPLDISNCYLGQNAEEIPPQVNSELAVVVVPATTGQFLPPELDGAGARGVHCDWKFVASIWRLSPGIHTSGHPEPSIFGESEGIFHPVTEVLGVLAANPLMNKDGTAVLLSKPCWPIDLSIDETEDRQHNVQVGFELTFRWDTGRVNVSWASQPQDWGVPQ